MTMGKNRAKVAVRKAVKGKSPVDLLQRERGR